MKYTYSILLFLFFTLPSYSQWNEFNDLARGSFSRDDTLFYDMNLELCTGSRANALILLDTLSLEYLLSQVNSGHWKSTSKALRILSYSDNESLVAKLAPLMQVDEQHAESVRYTLSRINGQIATPHFHQALIKGIGRYEKYNIFSDLIYSIGDFPDSNSLYVLTEFQNKIKGQIEHDQLLIELTERKKIVLRSYLGSAEERRQVLSAIFNDEKNIDFNWAVHRLEIDRRSEDLEILKKSKRRDVTEVLILRRYLGDQDFTETQKKMLEVLPMKVY